MNPSGHDWHTTKIVLDPYVMPSNLAALLWLNFLSFIKLANCSTDNSSGTITELLRELPSLDSIQDGVAERCKYKSSSSLLRLDLLLLEGLESSSISDSYELLWKNKAR